VWIIILVVLAYLETYILGAKEPDFQIPHYVDGEHNKEYKHSDEEHAEKITTEQNEVKHVYSEVGEQHDQYKVLQEHVQILPSSPKNLQRTHYAILELPKICTVERDGGDLLHFVKNEASQYKKIEN